MHRDTLWGLRQAWCSPPQRLQSLSFLNSFLNRNLFVCLCVYWFSAVYLAACFMRFTKCLLSHPKSCPNLVCVCGSIHILNLRVFTVTRWVFRQWLNLRWSYLHESLVVSMASWLCTIPKAAVHACVKWCHATLCNLVLHYVKCHKIHVHCKGAVWHIPLTHWMTSNHFNCNAVPW